MISCALPPSSPRIAWLGYFGDQRGGRSPAGGILKKQVLHDFHETFAPRRRILKIQARRLALAGPTPTIRSMSAPVPSPVLSPPRSPSLRLQIHLIVAALMGRFVVAVIALQIDATRRSVREEITAGNRVTGQLLQRVTWVYANAGPQALVRFLEQLDRAHGKRRQGQDEGI